jgi:hypothetical protein
LRTTCYGFGDRSSTRIRCVSVSLAGDRKDRGQHRCPLTFYMPAGYADFPQFHGSDTACGGRASRNTRIVLRGFGIADDRDV